MSVCQNGAIVCDECGKFMSTSDSNAMGWNYYGTAYDFEPPEPTDCCGKCWKQMDTERLERLKKICWIGPYKRFQGDT